MRRIITRGELRDNEDGCGCFVLDWHGVFYYLVVGFHEQGYRVVVTGWPIAREPDRAIESGRWRQQEVACIERFNARYFESSLERNYPKYIEWSKNHPDGGAV